MSRYKPSMSLNKEQIDALWKGSIDMHIHCAPDPEWNRRMDMLDIASDADRNGMRAAVMKSFYYPTTTGALIANRMVESTNIFGSVTIGYGTTGGLEYAAKVIENHAKIGCKVVWFPAFDALYCRNGLGREGGIRILKDNGELKEEAKDVLKIVKQYDMVLCSGHMSFEETYTLFAEAGKMGIGRMVATHPLSITWAPEWTMKQLHALTDMGAYVELVFNNLMPRLGSKDPADYIDCVRELGAEHMIMSTDLAQCMDPTPAEGMRFFIGTMLQFGCTEEEVDYMARRNPAKLLGLDDTQR